MSCRVPKVSSGRRIIVGALVLVVSVCRGVVVVVLFDLCFVCLFVSFVLATAEAFFSLGALRSPRRRGSGVAVLVEGERERDLLVQSCSCALLRSRVGRSVTLFSREQTAQGGG